jgi:hypothetical protein
MCPVEYGQLIDSEISWLEPSLKETDAFKDYLFRTVSQRDLSIITRYISPLVLRSHDTYGPT